MDLIVSFAEGFMNLFTVGADTFVSWVSGIVPKVLLLHTNIQVEILIHPEQMLICLIGLKKQEIF